MFSHHCLKTLTLVCLICFCWHGQSFSQEPPVVSVTVDAQKGESQSSPKGMFTVPEDYLPFYSIFTASTAENCYLEDYPVIKGMKNEEYNNVVAHLEDDIKTKIGPIDALWKQNSEDSLWRYKGAYLAQDLAILAEVFEYSGKYAESKNLYDVRSITRDDVEDYHWRNARINYAQRNYKKAFLEICEAVEEDYSFWNVDSAIVHCREVGKVYDWGGCEHHLWGAERDSMYRLKDKYVRVTYPDYHWKYPNSPTKKGYLKQFDESFQEFMAFIEREYSSLISDEIPCDKKRDNEDLYGPIVEQFRKLAQLP